MFQVAGTEVEGYLLNPQLPTFNANGLSKGIVPDHACQKH